MDPNTTHKELIDLANTIQDGYEDGHPTFGPGDAVELATMVIELDHWLRTGGFKPQVWDA